MKRLLALGGGVLVLLAGALLGSACTGLGPGPCGDLDPIEIRNDVYTITTAPREELEGETVDVDLESSVTISYVDDQGENWVVTYQPQ